ncbi:hypothetical protein RF11_06942 [Thelohanellus kitauei]|uniref:Uncharacterized protein n=1 Tax=Thelohanellus kitauei TaxID=669202 RepID=A0A0C2IST8_THEKT|nr:hypothetical protein RF11_06942 [Thelohanellus kitauei]
MFSGCKSCTTLTVFRRVPTRDVALPHVNDVAIVVDVKFGQQCTGAGLYISSDRGQKKSLKRASFDFDNFYLGNKSLDLIAFVSYIQINGQTPDVVIQIDETLLKGKRRANVDRLLRADENIPREEIEEWEEINQDGQLVPGRNHGRRITGPWIFGLVECHRQGDGNYKSGEVRLFIEEKRDQESLLPMIRRNVARGSMIWSDMWPPYMRIGQDGDGLIH